MIISNDDVLEALVEIPPGHHHVRTTIRLADGAAFTLQEATMANLLRAFVTVKTHPTRSRVRLAAATPPSPKPGFAPRQLLEVDDEDL